jgi:hypothetical protein
MSGAVRRARALCAGIMLLIGLAWLGQSPAGAAEGGAIKVTQFELQTTRTVQTVKSVTDNSELSHENWGFINEPAPFTQAGGHLTGQGKGADSLTTTIEFESQEIQEKSGDTNRVPVRDPKDILVNVPQGLLGNPTAVPRCPLKVALNGAEQCPSNTQIGVAVLYLFHGQGLVGPIVNVKPETGQSAEFAIDTVNHVNFLLTGHVVRTPDGYGLAVDTNGIPMTEIYKAETSFWGVPASKVHDAERGRFCLRFFKKTESWKCVNANNGPATGEESTLQEVPFLTMPADCAAGAGRATMTVDSWEEPGAYVSESSSAPAATGCDLLSFAPSIEANPDSLLADAPVGLSVDLSVPQVEQPEQFATPQLRRATVTLPQGLSISPATAEGIQACEETGPNGIDMPTGLNGSGEPLQPGELGEGEERGASGEPQLAAGHCPNASIVGTAKAFTPLLPEPVEGHVYLARPLCGGGGQPACTEEDVRDGRLYRLYLELGGTGKLANAGVNIKVRLDTHVDPVTGQLTTIADENPQLPFSKLEIKLKSGPRAPLANPAHCGPATTVADLTSWSAPGTTSEGAAVVGLPDATPSWSYEVGGCSGPPGLNPGFLAEMTQSQGGAFAPFELSLTRKDREQYLSGIELHMPPGLTGVLASVPLCGEPAAQQGQCPEASKVGTTIVASGAGGHPFEIGGNVYLTTGYKGAPFGLSIVTHVVAGPFNLGDVVVRARIDIDPTTAAVTVTSDPLPQIVFGVPLRLQRIMVNVDRPKFMLNPTNCNAQPIIAKISGSEGALADVSTPFAAGLCKNLAFKPRFTVSTRGHTSRKLGASLDAKLSYPQGAMGVDANIARVKVSLPKQLPSDLHTLQKACVAAIFESNPAQCPSASLVGVAKATTPLLPVKLEGPAYFVSHGGEAFPSLIIVLQGDGVRVDLNGSTFIKKGVTSSTFKTIPDVPVNTFELNLPQRADHALAANGNLCKLRRKLVMPTEFVAQNGAVIRHRTKIAVTGCPRHKHHKRHHTHRGKAPKKGHHRRR